MFSNWKCLGLIEVYDKSAAMAISAVFNTRKLIDTRMVLEDSSLRAFK